MQAFTVHRGIAAPLDRANVDTDAIIPKQFLKSIQRTGFGEQLFFDWRYQEDGSDNPDFVLNHAPYKGASVLVARNNFGCGSSREHAVWAVVQYGIRAILAPWKKDQDEKVPAFADIFRNNSVKNGLLDVELSPEEIDRIFEVMAAEPGMEITVDLQEKVIHVHAAEPFDIPFDIDEGVRDYLLKGLDDIALTMEDAEAIAAFEETHQTYR
jgi:3-isopropylmalate/(R)-2-methylmalate dehydratase small subunit